jgi:hypothetical protein
MQEKAGFTDQFDNDPALKGGQKNLPDGLQKSIISKAKGKMEEVSADFDSEKIIQDINTNWAIYVKSLVNDIRINGVDGYTTYSEDDFIADYEEYIGGKIDLEEDLDLGHTDNEPHMIKGELYRIGKYAMELYQMVDGFEEMGGEIDFPAWWQAKITTAMNNMVSAKHYLDFETKEPEIDAAVDVIDASDALNSTDINEATKMYYHVIEDVDGEKGWQGAYDTQDEAEKRADKLQDMFPRSFFYVEAYDSASEPYNITLEEGNYKKTATKTLAERIAKQLKAR